MGSAITQDQLWGVRARDWADVQEKNFMPIYEAVLQKTSVGPGTSVLDVGCGSGLFTQMAAQRGAQVSGLDASDSLLAIARERTPNGDFRVGEMADLPYRDQTFDLVTGFNSFQLVPNQVQVLQEARRTLRPDGYLVIAVFGDPKESDVAAYFKAMGQFSTPPVPGSPGPFALSRDGVLEALVKQAGLKPGKVESVDCPWQYPDEQTLLRALLSSGPGIKALRHATEAAVRSAILNSLAPFKTSQGGYRMRNHALYMIIEG